jgi:hypothetical protein
MADDSMQPEERTPEEPEQPRRTRGAWPEWLTKLVKAIGIVGVPSLGGGILIRFIPTLRELVAAIIAESAGILYAAGVLFVGAGIYWTLRQLKREPLGQWLAVVVIAGGMALTYVDRLYSRPAYTFRLQPNRGWQDTGFVVSGKREVVMRVTGRISLAINQEYHLAELAKHIISKGGAKLDPGNQKKYRFSAALLTQENSFNRTWIPPTGDPAESDMLDGLRMDADKDAPWGVVLCTVLRRYPIGITPETISERDPWSPALRIRKEDILAFVPAEGQRDATNDFRGASGALLCMVNDAVISDFSKNGKSEPQDYYEALEKSGLDATRDGLTPRSHDHLIKEEDIPFIFLNDNAGEFTLEIKER